MLMPLCLMKIMSISNHANEKSSISIILGV